MLSLVLLFVVVGCSTTTSKFHEIPNFIIIDSTNTIVRGGQPETNGFNYLKSIGINKIVKLNEESEGSDEYAKYLGMIVIYIPFNTWEQMIYTPMWKVNMAVTNITSNTFFHCQHGQDRTGLIGECYVISKGKSEKDAYKEMLDNGFHKSLLGLWYRSKHLK